MYHLLHYLSATSDSRDELVPLVARVQVEVDSLLIV